MSEYYSPSPTLFSPLVERSYRSLEPSSLIDRTFSSSRLTSYILLFSFYATKFRLKLHIYTENERMKERSIESVTRGGRTGVPRQRAGDTSRDFVINI